MKEEFTEERDYYNNEAEAAQAGISLPHYNREDFEYHTHFIVMESQLHVITCWEPDPIKDKQGQERQMFFESIITLEGEMKFLATYRHVPERADFYASDVGEYQKKRVSMHKGGYVGDLKKITRISVKNQETLLEMGRSIKEKMSNDEQLAIFFNNTPNGKSTKRMIDVWGIRATEITIIRAIEDDEKSAMTISLVCVQDTN